MVGGGLRSQLVRDLVRFRGLLCGGERTAPTGENPPLSCAHPATFDLSRGEGSRLLAGKATPST